jgi:hypothetical protein
VRADPEDALAAGTVPRDEIPDRILEHLVAELAQSVLEVVLGPAELRRVRVAADGIVGSRVVGTPEGLDVALDPLRADLTIDPDVGLLHLRLLVV